MAHYRGLGEVVDVMEILTDDLNEGELAEWIGRRLQELIELKGTNVTRLSEACGLDRRSVSGLVSGEAKRYGTGLLTLARVLSVLGLTLGDFFEPLRSHDGLERADAELLSRASDLLRHWRSADTLRITIRGNWALYLAESANQGK